MKEPIFILSPPRSFSSIVSSMIGQHPQLHAFPELQIFIDETMEEMITRNQERFRRLASAGAIRSIAQVHEQQQTDESCTRAWLWIQKHRHWTSREFFNYLLGKIDPLIGIEKTPVNTWKLSRLQRILRWYPNAKFLHLTRSVNSNAKSLTEFIKEQDKLLKRKPSNELTGRALSREYPASVWHICHRNIMTIRPLIKQGNYIRVKGEDLLNQPKTILTLLCNWLNIDHNDTAIEAMLRPHESPYAFVGPRIAVGGNDGKFMRNPVFRQKINANNETYKDKAKSTHVELNYKDFFSQYKKLSENDLRCIQQWKSQISSEITTMQSKLGY